jgi:hypothetical protein
MNVETTGQKWVASAPVLGLASTTIDFADAGIEGVALFGALDQMFTISSKNVASFSLTESNPAKVGLTINALSGFFSGKITLIDPHPVSGTPVQRTLPYSGVFDSDSATGSGLFSIPSLPTFISETKTGSVSISPSGG